jgi:hypothetical protein
MAINLYEMVDTWNDAAVTFTAIKMNVTDTASNAASLLMDLQVGGVSRFEVSKAGKLTIDRGAFQNGGVTFFGNPANFYSRSVGVLNFAQSNTLAVDIAYPNFTLSSDYTLAWASTSGAVGASGSKDLFIRRDAANTLAQRNATNAQTFRLYNTFTDASNYERGFMKWNGNVLEIGTEAAGTGASRLVRINSGTNSINFFSQGGNRLTLNSADFDATTANSFSIGRSARPFKNVYLGDFQQFANTTTPTTPDASKLRIYAKDNGAGKTQLVVLMPDGVETVLATES